MRHSPAAAALVGLSLLAACASGGDEVDAAMRELDMVDDPGIASAMMSVADPEEAVAFFAQARVANPGSMDAMRGEAASLVRANRATDGVAAWKAVVADPRATDADRVELAGAQIRINDWTGARATLDAIPPTYETFERYRYEAMVADASEDWARADSFYEIAAGLTTTPASVLNNWGYSKLTRGDYPAAERLFTDALRQDPTLFTAKNNLVLARGAQRNYDLPVIPMTQEERARLLYTLALTAIKQSDVTLGRGLLEEAVESSPRYFEEAARALAALEAG